MEKEKFYKAIRDWNELQGKSAPYWLARKEFESASNDKDISLAERYRQLQTTYTSDYQAFNQRHKDLIAYLKLTEKQSEEVTDHVPVEKNYSLLLDEKDQLRISEIMD